MSWKTLLEVSLYYVEFGFFTHNCKEKKLDGDISQATITNGIVIMEEILHEWSAQMDGEDVVMSESELSTDSHLHNLQKLTKSYQTSIEENSWLQSILTLL